MALACDRNLFSAEPISARILRDLRQDLGRSRRSLPLQRKHRLPRLPGVPLDLLFPAVCLGCRRLLRDEPPLPLCSLCAPEHLPLPPALRRVAGIEAVHAYAGPLARAVAALKFSGQLELAGPLGRLLSRADLLRQRWDAVIPVPLHPWRALLRGYNQAALLTRWALPAACAPALACSAASAPPPPRPARTPPPAATTSAEPSWPTPASPACACSSSTT